MNTISLLALTTLFAATAHALPEPGARIYGTIALNGVIVTAANSAVVIEARKSPTGPPIASYRMGSSAGASNYYSLKINGETTAALTDPNNTALGSTLYLVVRNAGSETEQKTFTYSERGLTARVDFGAADTDGDGMSDAFELLHFGSNTGGNQTVMDARTSASFFRALTHASPTAGILPI